MNGNYRPQSKAYLLAIVLECRGDGKSMCVSIWNRWNKSFKTTVKREYNLRAEAVSMFTRLREKFCYIRMPLIRTRNLLLAVNFVSLDYSTECNWIIEGVIRIHPTQVDYVSSFYSSLQVEFMAEDESINIVPNVRMDTLHMICVGVFFIKN